MTLVKNMTSNQENAHHVLQDCRYPLPPREQSLATIPRAGDGPPSHTHHTAPHRPTAIPVTAACPSAQMHSLRFNTSELDLHVESADITKLVKWRSKRYSSPNPQTAVTGRHEAQGPASDYCFIINPGCDTWTEEKVAVFSTPVPQDIYYFISSGHTKKNDQRREL